MTTRLKAASAALPIAAVLASCSSWYALAVPLNAGTVQVEDNAGFAERVEASWSMKRPVLPAPHQVFTELETSVFDHPVNSPRNLLYHAWVTLSAALVGLGFALVLGIVIAIGIVHVRSLDRSLMPWVVASQTVPVLAIAPMVVVVLGNIGITGLLPKALIAGYLSFFPITVGMVTGLRAADPMQFDLLRTYNAQRLADFRKAALAGFTRFPVSRPARGGGAGAGRRDRRGIADRSAGRARGEAAGRQLLWPNDCALGDAGHGCAAFGVCAGRGDGAGKRRAPLARRSDVIRGATLAVIALGAGLVARAGLGANWPAASTSLLAVIAFAAALASLLAFAREEGAAARLATPAVFGILVFWAWEMVVVGLDVPRVLLPAPSAIAVSFGANLPTLAADFRQTFLKAVLAGYAAGCASGFLVALAIDRSAFLRRGLLPLGNLASVMPIVGVAPIMVMWFGFDWPSKAAVVVVMTFFPMLVNTSAGLAASGAMERDLMRCYAAGYTQTLLKLRLPAALPHIFTALKLNSTLALIGAVVAEFFGTPILGMGFRISTEAARMDMELVWATIACAALAGSLSFGAIAALERAVTFWHPSFRD